MFLPDGSTRNSKPRTSRIVLWRLQHASPFSAMGSDHRRAQTVVQLWDVRKYFAKNAIVTMTIENGHVMPRGAAVKTFVVGAVIGVLLTTAERTLAADDIIPTKASPAPSAYDWTGLYVGSHLGYAAGNSNWSATQGGAATPSRAGSLDFFNAYDAFTGTGSYFLGLQAGYNYMLPSRLLLGVEADVSFPSVLGGTQMISSALIGQASYQEQVEICPARCALASGMRPGPGSSMRLAASPGATTNSPARNLPAYRQAARRNRARSSRCSWCRASAAPSAPASNSR